jgi:alkylation response protein AidB-like acyl-CoA dehydrogenase
MDSFGSTVPFAEPAWYNSQSSPYYKASHRRLRAFVRDYVDTYLAPFAEEWEAKGEVPVEAFHRHARLGFVAASIFPVAVEYLGASTPDHEAQPLPADIPPSEWDFFHDFVVTDEMIRVGYCGVVGNLGGGNAIGVPPILNFGTPEQKQKYLPGALRGQIRGCLAITEPDGKEETARKKGAINNGDCCSRE